ncbi:MAG: S-methyl-5-thioribose-1-phosphate isomerase [candidate division WOR-3 bacterium]
MIKPVEIFRDTIKIIDQTKLPDLVRFEYIYTLEDAIEAIVKLKVRGAPLIGIFAAYAVVQVVRNADVNGVEELKEVGLLACQELRKTRPTAVNLFYALDRMERTIRRFEGSLKEEFVSLILREAEAIDKEEGDRCEKIAKEGIRVLPENSVVMTICNTGYLATNHIGTALGVVYKAKAEGKLSRVFILETRPVLQGARLTAWELLENGIEPVLITDNQAAFIMKTEKINAVFVGADRIAKNGDTANKVGTYMLAVLAKYHGVPFYVVAPTSSIDPSVPSGREIKIEIRDKNEVIKYREMPIAPENVQTKNFAFDITPAELITGIITEKGIYYPPFDFSQEG